MDGYCKNFTLYKKKIKEESWCQISDQSLAYVWSGSC